MNRQEIESQLIAKASTDPAFRQRLLDAPKAAIAEVLGMELPPDMTITVLEEAVGHHILVLPPAQPNLDALPLADLELALIGGGRTLRPGNPHCSARSASASNARSSLRSSC
ncbi:NHLP leader peptide family natural product precursor [bacterium]|nr:NHLP leader peptide family natural product precursor [bacterium]